MGQALVCATYRETQWGLSSMQAKALQGYPDALDLVLRDQNQVAKALVERRQNVAKAVKSETSLGQLTALQLSTSPVPSSLAVSEESQALAFFVPTWVTYPRDSPADRGFIEILPLFFGHIRTDSPLSLALTAASFVAFGKWERKLRDFEYLAFPYYGKALRATRLALQDSVESISDETLMAICLLGYYEAIVDAFNAKISSPNHFNGADALVEKRQGQRLTQLAQKLLIGVRNSIVSRAIQFSLPIDNTSKVWQDKETSPNNAAELLDMWSVDVANLLVVAKQFDSLVIDVTQAQSDRGIPPNEPTEFLIHAKATDTKLATWPNMVPLHWFPSKILALDVPQTVVDAGLYGSTCDIYPDIMICCAWNDWRIARLKVLSLIARLGSGDSATEAVDGIQLLVDDICACVPFTFGSREKFGRLHELQVDFPCPLSKGHQITATAFGGWYLFAPLKEALIVAGYLRMGQREWIRSQMLRLAKMYDVEP